MPAESFRIAGMTNPAISVPAGAHVSIELVNADDDMAHGLVIMPAGTASSYLPMMTAAPLVQRIGAVVPRQAHRRRDARRSHHHLHCRFARQLSVPVPRPRPRPRRHDRLTVR
jgi:hypothetical protein